MFKKKEVVMLPTNQKATDKPFSVGITLCNDGKLRFGNPVGKSESRQELYFLSDEPIQNGDWVAHYSKDLGRYIISQHAFGKSTGKKVIATTDEPLQYAIDKSPYPMEIYGLPQPSQAFIEKYVEEYNKGNIITHVMVEYDPIAKHERVLNDEGEICDEFSEELKVSKDNTITIKKVKDSWNREEVVDLINKSHYDRTSDGMLYTIGKGIKKEWLEDNL